MRLCRKWGCPAGGGGLCTLNDLCFPLLPNCLKNQKEQGSILLVWNHSLAMMRFRSVLYLSCAYRAESDEEVGSRFPGSVLQNLAPGPIHEGTTLPWRNSYHNTIALSFLHCHVTATQGRKRCCRDQALRPHGGNQMKRRQRRQRLDLVAVCARTYELSL
jgi:hypothetical protein